MSKYVHTGASSGLFAGIAGLVSINYVRRALRDGSSERAIRRATMAVFWVGVAMTQWGLNRSSRQASRASHVGPSAVVERGADMFSITERDEAAANRSQ